MSKFPQDDGQKRCALDMGVDPYQYITWENGLRTPYKRNLSLIANYFGITVEQLSIASGDLDVAIAKIQVSTVTHKPETTVPTPKKKRERPHSRRVTRQAEDTKSPAKRSVKTMSLAVPAELLNVKTVKLTYEGDISVVGVEFSDKQTGLN